MTDVLVAGETLIDLIPDERTALDRLSGFTHRPGGAPATVAAGLASLDASVALWTRLGDDSFGDYLRETLSDRGLPAGPITDVADGQTTLAVVTPDAGDVGFEFYGDRDTTFGFAPDGVPRSPLADCSWVHLGGAVLAHPRGAEAMRALLRAAPDRCTVSFDPNTRPALWPDDRADRITESLTRVLDEVDVLACSPADFRPTEFPEDHDRLLAALLRAGPHTVFLTRGGDPTLVCSSDAAPWGRTEATAPTFSTTVVDPTGAGDGFAAGAIDHLAGGTASPEAAARVGNAVGALTVRERGGMSALPTRTAVEALLDD